MARFLSAYNLLRSRCSPEHTIQSRFGDQFDATDDKLPSNWQPARWAAMLHHLEKIGAVMQVDGRLYVRRGR